MRSISSSLDLDVGSDILLSPLALRTLCLKIDEEDGVPRDQEDICAMTKEDYVLGDDVTADRRAGRAGQ